MNKSSTWTQVPSLIIGAACIAFSAYALWALPMGNRTRLVAVGAILFVWLGFGFVFRRRLWALLERLGFGRPN
jgi:hypothetical protein